MENKDIIDRIMYYIDNYALTKPAPFAIKAGVDPSGFNKMLKGQQTITVNTLKRIADAYNINLVWLRTGEGPMLRSAEERLLDMVDEERAKSIMQQFGGHHNQQTMQQAGKGETENEQLDLLKKIIEDKDKEIAFLRRMLEQMSAK